MELSVKLNILLICDKPPHGNDANTITEHIDSFSLYSQHQIFTYSNLGDFHKLLNINRFDVIIVHYSMYLLNDDYISRKSKRLLTQFKGLKVLFVQDEYRLINKLIDEINGMKFDLFFTCFPEGEIEKIYPESKLFGVVKRNNLTGYIPKNFLMKKDHIRIADRPIDVGYRSRKVPFWLGELGYEKWSIVDRFKEFTMGQNLALDLSYQEEDRIYGDKWPLFVGSCKAVLGVESGASVMDFTGKLQTLIEFHQSNFPEDSFHEIQSTYLHSHEGLYKLNQISPRIFEAIALKTVLVLYEGDYSNILIPGRHYIMLKKDFSNIDYVVDCLKNNTFMQNMADTAYEEIALNYNYSYEHFIKRVDDEIASEFKKRSKIRVENPYSDFLEFYGSLKDEIVHYAEVKPFNKTLFKLPVVGKAIKSIKKNSTIRNAKKFLTRRVKIFNPLLRRIKYVLLSW